MKHVVLLRGVNVGGKNRLPMTALVAALERVGGRDVVTYIQSGNAIVSASAAVVRQLPRTLPAALAELAGIEVPVIVRSAAELAAARAGHPFGADGVDERELHVGFLASAPSAARIAALDPARSPGDRCLVRGRELYLHLPRGAGQSKLTSAYLDRVLGTITTVRNWATVAKLVELSS